MKYKLVSKKGKFRIKKSDGTYVRFIDYKGSIFTTNSLIHANEVLADLTAKNYSLARMDQFVG